MDLRIVFGFILLSVGSGLCALSWRRFFAFRLTHWQHAAEVVKALLLKVPEHHDSAAAPEDKPHLPTTRLVRIHQFESNEGVQPVPFHEHNTVDTKDWALAIALAIYRKAGAIPPDEMVELFKRGTRGSLQEIDNANQLVGAGWVQLIAHPELLDGIRHRLGYNHEELSAELAREISEWLRPHISAAVFQGYRPSLQIFKDARLRPTSYRLNLFPLLPEGEELECSGAITLKPIGAKATLPLSRKIGFRVADQVYGLPHYVPFLEKYGEVVAIGPHPWCHIQTSHLSFDAVLTLRWRKSQDPGFVGVLEVLDFEGEGRVLLDLAGYSRARLDRKKTGIKIPPVSGARTTATLYWEKDGECRHVGNLTLANESPDADSLPEVTIFEKVDWEGDGKRGFARFAASQIHLATRLKDAGAKLRYLHDQAGRDFLTAQQLWRDDAVTKVAQVTGDHDLCYRVKMVVPPDLVKLFKKWYGNIAYRDGIVAEIESLIATDEFYKRLFAEDARAALKASETKPGLTLEITTDEAVRSGSLLLKALPIMTSVRRREIMGEILMEHWQGAEDISGMSCNPKRNFLIEYPTGYIMMRLSKFPLYGIRAPQVQGALGISLEEPGTSSARVTVENHGRGMIDLDGVQIPPGEDHSRPTPAGKHHRLKLAMDGQYLEIVIYPEPVQQVNEAEFVPAPGKLSFHGITLGRRQERAAWRSTPFESMIADAKNRGEELEILGVGQMTGNGFIASLVRGGVQEEVHFFAGRETILKSAGHSERLAGKSSTLESTPLAIEATIWEDKDPGNVITYSRVDFLADTGNILNADILLFAEARHATVSRLLPEGHAITHVDLLRCDPADLADLDRHLYLAWNDAAGDDRHGWLYSPGARIGNLYMDAKDKVWSGDLNREVVGPLDVTRQYWVDWEGEQGTPLSFAADSHLKQVETYLYDGTWSLKKGNYYVPGGRLSTSPEVFSGREDLFISTQKVKLSANPRSFNPKGLLPYDPSEIAPFFDKDSYSIEYSAEARNFVVRSRLHPRLGGGVTPKTVFMIIPSGKRPILGSHALPYVVIPPGQNLLVFPGISFMFSQGPIYYGFNV